MAPSLSSLAPVCGLFEELANPVRLHMLQELAARPGNLTEMGRVVELSPQEVARHLARLARLGLVAREGRNYRATEYGRALLEQLPGLAHLDGQRDFFASHDLSGLPPGMPMLALAQARRVPAEPQENRERLRDASGRAERRVAYVGEHVARFAQPLGEAVQRGVEVELVLPWTLAGSEAVLSLGLAAPEGARVRVHLLGEVPLALLATEAEAYASFRDRAGAFDEGELVGGREPGFHAWAQLLVVRLLSASVPAYDSRQHEPGQWRRALTVAAGQFLSGARRAPPREDLRAQRPV